MRTIPYTYRHCPVPGGGYATGFLYHPSEKGLLYLRTDIGGAYRFDPTAQTWRCLTTRATPMDAAQTHPIAMAVDANRPEMLCIICGEWSSPRGELALSWDRGEHFTVKPVPFFAHGNLGGRGTGERLLADGDTLWYASQRDGLWMSPDLGDSWQHVDALPETHLTFCAQAAGLLAVGSAGVANIRDGFRGPALYVSSDGGKSFRAVQQPPGRATDARLFGLAAQRWYTDGRCLYVTYSANGPCSIHGELGYSCDSGDALDGHIVRYPLTAEGLGPMEDITPGRELPYGFSGIDGDGRGMLVATTICKRDGDSVLISMDGGDTWREVLCDLRVGDIRFRTPYMKPEHNGGRSLIHWLSDIKLDPFDRDSCWFNTGTGVFRGYELTKPTCYFTDWSDGVEETVHLNVYAPPSGPVQALDMIGDLGGFAFTDVNAPCEDSFNDGAENRYITCINADFGDADPSRVAVTARGNWTGRTKGGLILSEDYGLTWRRLTMPWGLTEEIDRACQRIEKPNINPGWVAMNGQTLVWTLAEGRNLPVARVVYSSDLGNSWGRSTVLGLDGAQTVTGGFKAFADRVTPGRFYGFGDHSDLYLSDDGGRTFRQLPTPENFPPGMNCAIIDAGNPIEIRGEAGRPGRFLMALGTPGLWTLAYTDGSFTAVRLSAEGDAVFRAGYGLGAPGADYITGHKAIYASGVIGGRYGFYRTFDDGANWQRVNRDEEMFGRITSIDGDCRVFGRFFLATGTCGLIYGEEKKT